MIWHYNLYIHMHQLLHALLELKEKKLRKNHSKIFLHHKQTKAKGNILIKQQYDVVVN